MSLLFQRGLYHDTPPPSRTREQNVATLLYSWWCTLFSIAFILTRLGGRMIRNDMLFREDKIMALAMVFLLARMAFVHVVLIWGTNNEVVPDGADATLIYHREIGSRLVLAARVFYALYIWTAKFTVLEFLRRMTKRFWKRSYEFGLHCITGYLVASFLAVVIATIAECSPITHYWQVVPDPGPHCREGLVQLITMGVADSTTDILIVAFPVPIILASSLPLKRKMSLTILFSLSLILIVITANRVSAVIAYHGRQQYRTVWASSECLAAAVTSNAVVIGSFLRDRGLKKNKFKFGSTTDSMDRPSNTRQQTLTTQHWGSDEDLVAGMGYRLEPALQSRVQEYRAPGAVDLEEIPAASNARSDESDILPINSRDWQFEPGNEYSHSGSEDSESNRHRSAINQETPAVSPRKLSNAMPRSGSMSFADIGGLLDDAPLSRRSSTTLASNSLSGNAASPGIHGAEPGPFARRGSRTLLIDLGGYLSPTRSRDESQNWPLDEVEEHEHAHDGRLAPPPGPSILRSTSRSRSRSPGPVHALDTSNPPTGIPSPHIRRTLGSPMSLQDAGGLLLGSSPPTTPATTIAGNRQSLQDVGGLLMGPIDDITPAATSSTSQGYFTPPSHVSLAGSSVSRLSDGQRTPTQQDPGERGAPARASIASSHASQPNVGKRGSSTRFREEL